LIGIDQLVDEFDSVGNLLLIIEGTISCFSLFGSVLFFSVLFSLFLRLFPQYSFYQIYKKKGLWFF